MSDLTRALARIYNGGSVTLASVPDGFDALVSADLARGLAKAGEKASAAGQLAVDIHYNSGPLYFGLHARIDTATAITYAVSFILIRTISRYREYAADRGSALITGAPE